MVVKLPSFKLWHDFGVSALALTMVLCIMAGGAAMLLWKAQYELALAWVAAMGLQAKPFYDGYITYKKNGGNGSPP